MAGYYSRPNNSSCFEMCFCVGFGPYGFFVRVEIFETIDNRVIITKWLCNAASGSHRRRLRSQSSYQYLIADQWEMSAAWLGKNCLNQLGSGLAMNDDYSVDHRVSLLGYSFSHLFVIHSCHLSICHLFWHLSICHRFWHSSVCHGFWDFVYLSSVVSFVCLSSILEFV